MKLSLFLLLSVFLVLGAVGSGGAQEMIYALPCGPDAAFLDDCTAESLGAWGGVHNQATWAQLGILGDGFDGAGITIDYPWLYVQSQNDGRTYVLQVTTSFPPAVVQTWFSDNLPYSPWGAGMDSEPNFWSGHVCCGSTYSKMHEMTTYPPTPTLTDHWFEASPAEGWMADISENRSDNKLYIVHVGGDNHIYCFDEPSGTPCGDFGDPAWDYVSQRAITYNNDNNTFFIGGWNSELIWEVDADNLVPIPGRVRCGHVSGLAYQDRANGGPCLWAQTNSCPDMVCWDPLGLGPLPSDDIGILSIDCPRIPFVSGTPLAVTAKLANFSNSLQDFKTQVVMKYGSSTWSSVWENLELDKFESSQHTYEVFGNGLAPGTALEICVYIDNPDDEDPSNDFLCASYTVTGSCVPYATDDGEYGNAFYYTDYNWIAAKRMGTGINKPVTLTWAAVNTVSKGEPYYTWPDPVYDEVEICAWCDNDGNGVPDPSPIWSKKVTPTDVHWVGATIPPGTFTCSNGVVWVGMRNLGYGCEGIVTDPPPKDAWPPDCEYFDGQYWYSAADSCTGDWHIRGCLEYPGGTYISLCIEGVPKGWYVGNRHYENNPPLKWDPIWGSDCRLYEFSTFATVQLDPSAHHPWFQNPYGDYRLKKLIIHDCSGEKVINDPQVFSYVFNSTTEVRAVYEYKPWHPDNSQFKFLSLSAALDSAKCDDKKVDKKIDRAMDELAKALDGCLWLDSAHLRPKHGAKVFDELKDIPKELCEVIKMRVPEQTKSICMDVLGGILNNSGLLAEVPVREACQDKNSNPKELKKAIEEMGKAFDKLQDYRYSEAIDHYKHAWEHAVKALEKVKEPKQEQMAIGDRGLPRVFSLSQNYPNPAMNSTTIQYALPKDCHVRLAVYNLTGQRVMTLVDEEQNAGYRSVKFDTEGFAGGIYFYRLEAGGFVSTKKAVVLR